MKAIMIFDMPDSMDAEKISIEIRAKSSPLVHLIKPKIIPLQKREDQAGKSVSMKWFIKGWNACIADLEKR